jgi:hypothetical protein
MPGLAFGTQTGAVPPPYLDSAALVTGACGNDQFVQIVVWWDGASGTNSDYDEVEIRLRGTLAKNLDRTYNINCRVGTPSGDSYIQMGRANGPPDDFTPPIAELHGASAACQNGDVITGTIVGGVITAYINGKKVIQGMDSVITSVRRASAFFTKERTRRIVILASPALPLRIGSRASASKGREKAQFTPNPTF